MEHRSDDGVLKVLGGSPSLYMQLVQTFTEYGLMASIPIFVVEDIKRCVYYRFRKAIYDGINGSSDKGLGELIKFLRETEAEGDVLSTLVLKAKGIKVEYANKIFRQSKLGDDAQASRRSHHFK